MAGTGRHTTAAVNALRQLESEPEKFSLFAALRLFEQATGQGPRLGEARRPADEMIRLEQPPYLCFAPSDVLAFRPLTGGRWRLAQYGFGVFGPNGALPSHLTEYADDRRRHHDDGAMVDFVNLFQHRFIALFYRAWAEADPVAGQVRGDGRFASYLGALFGLSGEAAWHRDVVDDAAKLCRAALFAHGTRSAEGLEGLLRDYFGLPIRIAQFVGEWLEIPHHLRTELSRDSPSAVLGVSATLGGQSWQRQGRFDVHVGPLDFETFVGWLPGSRALAELRALVRLYASGQYSCEVRLSLRENEAPGTTLGAGARLGWTSWLGHRAGIADDVVLQGGEHALD